MSDCFKGNDLSCYKGDRCIFKKVSFSIISGDALVLRGPNGSGKSSLLRLMASLDNSKTGEIKWNNKLISKDPILHRERVHYLGHSNAIKLALTVKENLAVWPRLMTIGRSYKTEIKEKLDYALEAFNIQHLADLPARLLSSGERRRLALARLLVSNATLWLLDEPTTGLDKTSQVALEKLLSAHLTNSGMVVISIHGPLHIKNFHSIDLASNAAFK